MKTILIICLGIASFLGYCQQEPQFTMFWNNYSLYNPANTGVSYKHFGAVNFRDQWVSFDGSPLTVTANYDAKINAIGGGAGIGYMYDQLGAIKSNRVYLNYAYHLSLGENILSFGVAGVYNALTIDGTQFPPDDPGLISELKTQGKFNASVGALFKTPVLEVGISSTQLNEPHYDNLFFKNKRHYFLMAAYNFKLSEKFQLKTSALAKTDATASMFEINNMCTYNELYWLGFTVRPSSLSAYGFQAGIQFLNKFKIGYGYDHTIGPYSIYFGPSHELMFAVMINEIIKP